MTTFDKFIVSIYGLEFFISTIGKDFLKIPCLFSPIVIVVELGKLKESIFIPFSIFRSLLPGTNTPGCAFFIRPSHYMEWMTIRKRSIEQFIVESWTHLPPKII